MTTRSLRRDPVPAGLVRMRLIATGLLLAMAAVFVASRSLVDAHPAWGFVRAFAEAAMVGGLADWFAVTALFRAPLGLPIPHTAIVPRNKDRIGDQLAQFLRDNFLITAVIGRRMRRLDVAAALARWLTDPAEGAGGRFRAGASRMAAQVLEALDPARLGGMVRAAIAGRLRETEASPILGQLLAAAMAEDRHKPLLDAAIRWAGKALATNDQLIRRIVHDRAGSVLRWTGLDETIADKLIGGLDKLLANPAMQRWLEGLWEQGRGLLLAIARDPERAMRGRLGEVLRQLGTTLRDDHRLARGINRFVRRAVVGVAADYGDGIVRLVSETVHGWDAETITHRLENAVGKDLQFIRVNGTLVGGLVGLAIHAADLALG